MLLKAKLDRIRKMHPRGPTAYGQIYSGRLLRERRWKRVTLYTLFRSDENTHLLRPHVFESERARDAKAWAGWFSKHLREIHIKAVLPGLGIRTDKSWTVERILGWSANAKHSVNYSRMARKGHKAKPSRKPRG
jgi:hypothetical protein